MILSTNTLTYNSKTKTFVGFLSDFLRVGENLPSIITVKSHKTGMEKLFEFGDAESIDGDLVAYFYNCLSDNLFLTMYND